MANGIFSWGVSWEQQYWLFPISCFDRLSCNSWHLLTPLETTSRPHFPALLITLLSNSTFQVYFGYGLSFIFGIYLTQMDLFGQVPKYKEGCKSSFLSLIYTMEACIATPWQSTTLCAGCQFWYWYYVSCTNKGWRATYVVAGAPGLILAILLSLAEEPRNNSSRLLSICYLTFL